MSTGSPTLSRRSLIVLGAAAATTSSMGQADAMTWPFPVPLRSSDLLESIGVNTHLSYADSQYGDLGNVLRALNFAGIQRIRDSAINSAHPNARHYLETAKAGVRMCLFWGAKRTMEDAISQISGLEGLVPGCVDALEGPNEIKPAFAYGDLQGNEAARRFMSDMRLAASKDNRLRHKPIVNFTSYAPAAADCDYANQHPYPKGGSQPRPTLRRAREEYVGPIGVMPGKPMMFTEFGYHTRVGQPAGPTQWQGVDEERQAVLLINALLDNAGAKITRTYIYELLDEARGGIRAGQEAHFGLFTADGAPKQAAKALRNFTALLADHDSRAEPVTPGALGGSWTSADTVNAAVVRKRSGEGFLMFWNEAPVWDKEAIGPLEVQPVPVAVTLASKRPLTGTDIISGNPVSVASRPGQFVFQLAAHPVALGLGPEAFVPTH